MAGLDLSINVDEVIDAADRLARIESTLVGTTAVKSINKVLPRTYELASKKMLSGINFSKADIEQQVRVEKATDILKPEGAIVADRKTLRPLTMRRFVLEQIWAPVRWPNSKIASKLIAPDYGRISPKTKPVPWKPRLGDPKRGIPRDKKFNGVAVQVTRGRTRYLTPSGGKSGWFLLPTKNGLLPARVKNKAIKRWGRSQKEGAIEVIHGPSIWQLFKAQIPGMREQVLDDLRKTLSADVRDDIMSLFK